MKTISKLVLIVVGGLLLAGPAAAHRQPGKSLDGIADRQQARIAQGVRQGDLTRDEARKLRRQQERIEKTLQRYARDGRLSHKEREKILARYERASDAIYRLRHNDDRRWRHNWRARYQHNHQDRTGHPRSW